MRFSLIYLAHNIFTVSGEISRDRCQGTKGILELQNGKGTAPKGFVP